MSNEFDGILNYDPLLEAEKVTGLSYKEDDGTRGLGMLLAMEHGKRKQEELALRGDTYWSMPWTEAMDVFLGQGFETVWAYTYVDKRGNNRQAVAMWSDGVLLVADEYDGLLNTTRIEFNWRPFEGSDDFVPFFHNQISGGMYHRGEGFDDIEGDPWTGVADIHVVEGFIHKLEKLRASGQLLKTWYITDTLLSIYSINFDHEWDKNKPWHEHADRIRRTVRERVAQFDEPARSAIEAGMFGERWEKE